MLSESVIQNFKTTLRGQLLLPGAASYDKARKIHNAMIDRHPAMIVRCAGVADVVAAVRFAVSQLIPVSVHGTGHNVTGISLCDDGIVIDLSVLKGIHVSPEARTARVEPGVTWGELNHELQMFELAATGGQGYGAYLGTIPDMSESPGGVRITGVRAGSPAIAAGSGLTICDED